jgi:NitT/TauT family transport system ATP-binding protein
MMLDEPFSQQDRDRQRDLEDLVFASVRDRGQTALIVSHDLDALAAICDRIVLLGGSPARVVGDLRTPSDLTRLPPARRRAAADFVRHNEQVWHERARVALA